MATYVNDLRLTELATGEGSGTWGTTTNVSLELIGEALGYATQQVFGSDADATTTIADGASDPARAMYFKITSAGSLTATRTCTIAPNTVSRVMFIENATTGSQSISISQGSGANVTILTGKTAVVYLDGAGSGAAVIDAMAGVDPGVTDTLTEVLVAGNTSGGTNIELSTTDKVQFRDSAIYINSSADGQLDLVADTEIQIAATTVDLNGNLDVSGTVVAGGVVTANAGVVVDNFTLDGTTLALSSGAMTISGADDLTLDFESDINIDANGGDIRFKDGGTHIGSLYNSSNNFAIYSAVNNADLLLQGQDGGSTITALTFDMSAAGAATFNSTIATGSGGASGKIAIAGNTATSEATHITFTNGAGAKVFAVGGGQSGVTNNGFVIRNVTDNTFPLVISDAGAATFNSSIDAGAGLRFSTDGSNNGVITTLGQDKDLYFSGDDGGAGINALVLDMSAAGAATFNSGVTATSLKTTDFINIQVDDAQLYFANAANNRYNLFERDASNNFYLKRFDGSSVVTDLTFNSAGAATFNSSLTVDGVLTKIGGGTSSQTVGLVVDHGSSTGYNLIQAENDNGTWFKVAGDGVATFNGNLDVNGASTFNEGGADVDFRVESDTNTHALFVEGSSGNVGLGVASPAATIHADASGGAAIRVSRISASASAYGQLEHDGTNTTLTSTASTIFNAGGSEAARFDSSQNLLVGKSSDDFGTVGAAISQVGEIQITRASATPLYVRRNTSDGELIGLYKDGNTVGNIGTHSASTYIGQGDTGLYFNNGNNSIDPYNTSTPAPRGDSISLGAASRRFADLYLSGGVYFDDAGGSGTTSSNYLDAYEEGAWTPVIRDTNAAGTIVAITAAACTYTKIGRIVTLVGSFTRNDAATLTGNLVITGLPFTATGGQQMGGNAWIDNASGDILCQLTAGNTSTMFLKSVDAPDSYVTTDDLANSRHIYFTRTYQAS